MEESVEFDRVSRSWNVDVSPESKNFKLLVRVKKYSPICIRCQFEIPGLRFLENRHWKTELCWR